MSTLVIARKEFADAVRSRTLWGIVAIIAVMTSLAMAVTAFVPGEPNVYAAIGGASQFAGILVPIMALVAASLAIAGERESGSIKILLGLPPTRGEVLAGKFLGRSLVVIVGIVVGFAFAAVVAVVIYGSVPPVAFAGVTLLSAALGVAFVGIGIGISATTATRSRAMTYGISAYLLLTLLWDLVPEIARLLFGSGNTGGLEAWYLFLTVLSPTGAFNGLAREVLSMGAGGPGFGFALAGETPFYLEPAALAVILVLWTVVPLVVGYLSFRDADLS
ncbi:MAG: ABC transporter permease subunit [Halobacteriota archaeon]